jgi:hypothetical protein
MRSQVLAHTLLDEVDALIAEAEVNQNKTLHAHCLCRSAISRERVRA